MTQHEWLRRRATHKKTKIGSSRGNRRVVVVGVGHQSPQSDQQQKKNWIGKVLIQFFFFVLRRPSQVLFEIKMRDLCKADHANRRFRCKIVYT